MKYTVIVANDNVDLKAKVEAKLNNKDGARHKWKLQGGVAAFAYPSGTSIYAQAVVSEK